MKFDVTKIATLASLPLSPTEKTKLEQQLEETTQYVEELSEIKTDGLEPTSQVTGLENVVREDEIKPSLTQEEALKNAKATQNGFFKVKGVLEND